MPNRPDIHSIPVDTFDGDIPTGEHVMVTLTTDQLTEIISYALQICYTQAEGNDPAPSIQRLNDYIEETMEF